MSSGIKQKGNFKKTNNFLRYVLDQQYLDILNKYGAEGVRALSANTPIDTGETASSWSYEIIRGKNKIILAFNNDHIEKGVPIAVILQYGHATRNGGWVEGIDYINPAIQPIFRKIANDAWGRVVNVQQYR